MVTVALALVGCKPEPLDPSLYPDGPVELTMFDPAPAAMIHTGPITVHGVAKGLSDLKIDGRAAQVDGTSWSANLTLPRGISMHEVAGLDSTGSRVYLRQSVEAGDYGAPDAVIDQGIGIRVNQGGLDAAADAVGGLVSSQQIAAILPSINPVYHDEYGVFGINAVEITADVQSLDFGNPQVSLKPGAGELEIQVALPNLRVVVPTYGQAIGIDFDENLTLTSSAAVLHGYLELGAKNGALTADLVDTTVTLQDFFFDTSILPGPIEDVLLSGTIEGVVEGLLTDQISAMVPDLLNQQLSTLQIAFGTDLLGKHLDLGATFDQVSIDRDGLQLTTDVGISVDGKKLKDTEGWLETGKPRPAPSNKTDVGVQISDDVVNKLLHDLWRAGLLDLKLSTEDGSLEPLLLAPLGAGPEGGSITTSAALPPVLVQDGGNAVLQLGELQVTIDTPGGQNGNHLVAVVGGQIPIDLELVDQNLTLKLGDPEIALMVRDNDWGGDNDTITDVITSQLPVATLLALVGDLKIPVPSLGGLTIPNAKIDRDPSGYSTTVVLKF